MSLRLKFNLVLIITSIFGIIIAGFISYDVLTKNAREEVLGTASVIMESALAIRNYTVQEIRPLLDQVESDEYIEQSGPAYAASKYIKNLQKKYPNFVYREAALNPINPIDKATGWEADIIEWFRLNSDAEEWIGERETPNGSILYLSRPIKIAKSEPIGAQVVSVPKILSAERAEQEFITFMAILLGVFVLIGLAFNILFNRFVIKPVTSMAKHADEVSMGTLDLPELSIKGKDEISTMARSFNRMQRSLVNAMKMLGD